MDRETMAIKNNRELGFPADRKILQLNVMPVHSSQNAADASEHETPVHSRPRRIGFITRRPGGLGDGPAVNACLWYASHGTDDPRPNGTHVVWSRCL